MCFKPLETIQPAQNFMLSHWSRGWRLILVIFPGAFSTLSAFPDVGGEVSEAISLQQLYFCIAAHCACGWRAEKASNSLGWCHAPVIDKLLVAKTRRPNTHVWRAVISLRLTRDVCRAIPSHLLPAACRNSHHLICPCGSAPSLPRRAYSSPSVRYATRAAKRQYIERLHSATNVHLQARVIPHDVIIDFRFVPCGRPRGIVRSRRTPHRLLIRVPPMLCLSGV